jgi:hypothetical protein
VAQPGSALAWGARGRRFESFHTDQQNVQGRLESSSGRPFSLGKLANRVRRHTLKSGDCQRQVGVQKGYKPPEPLVLRFCTPTPWMYPMLLTDAACRNASCPPDRKQARYADAGGLYLEVSASGSRRWFWKFRIEGVEKNSPWAPISTSTMRVGAAITRHARSAIWNGCSSHQRNRGHRVVGGPAPC